MLIKKGFINSLTFKYLLSLSPFPSRLLPEVSNGCCPYFQRKLPHIDNVYLIRLPDIFLRVHLIYNLNKIRYGQTNFDFGIRDIDYPFYQGPGNDF